MIDESIYSNKMFPMLVIGDAVVDFKKVYRGPINNIASLDDLRDMVAYYNGLTHLDRWLVIEDISLFSKADNGEGLLLKFVEDCPLKLVLLSRFDKASPVLLSRCKRVEKYYRDGVDSQFLSPKDGQAMVEQVLEPNTHWFDLVRAWGRYSPKLLYVNEKVRSSRSRRKLVDFM